MQRARCPCACVGAEAKCSRSRRRRAGSLRHGIEALVLMLMVQKCDNGQGRVGSIYVGGRISTSTSTRDSLVVVTSIDSVALITLPHC